MTTSVAADDAEDAVLYERVAPELIRFATALVGRVDAPDVLSAAIVKVLATPGWPAVVNRRAYLYRSVYNRRGPGYAGRDSVQSSKPGLLGSPLSTAGSCPPDVRVAVAGLSVRQRAVIVLTYWADLDPRSVAEWLGISEGSVRRHLARARGRLREVLDA
jgi:DNA-directed RNA polymerase specialized sigma24 family protein